MSRLLTAAVLSALSASGVAQGHPVGVKVVKEAPTRASAPPEIQILGEGIWTVNRAIAHTGENDWEAYFELTTSAGPNYAATEAEITLAGAKAARVIVWKQDVPFHQEGDRIRFTIPAGIPEKPGVNMIQTRLTARGMPEIFFRHNWDMRAAGRWSGRPFPYIENATAKNLNLAAAELLRRWEDEQRAQGPLPYDGRWITMDFETSAPRAHLDMPADWHIQLWEHADVDGRRILDSIKHVPHFLPSPYDGRLVYNNYSANFHTPRKLRPEFDGEFVAGQPNRHTSLSGQHVVDMTIRTDGGLDLTRPGMAAWSLRPDPFRGFGYAAWVYRNEEPVARAMTRDDAERGEIRLRLDLFDSSGQIQETWLDDYAYDPFTGNVTRQPRQGRASSFIDQ